MNSVVSKKTIRPMTPDDALKLISMDRMKRTLIKASNGMYSLVKNVDEEALANENIRLDAEEDQPAFIQVADDEIVAYLDEQTGYYYDCDGFVINLAAVDSGS